MKIKKKIYKIKNKSKLIREELGVNYIPTVEPLPTEIKKSKYPKTTIFNDIDLNNWKDYSDIITDSLWLLGARDKSDAHSGEYHGNFVPQIPHQAILRYTKKVEIVLDTFLGSGTTLIECKRLGRHGIGVELLANMVKRAKELIGQEQNPYNVKTDIIEGDNTVPETIEKVKKTLKQNYNTDKVQLIIMHPPYHDIIKFSNNPNDLCNTKTTDEFLNKFSQIVKNKCQY